MFNLTDIPYLNLVITILIQLIIIIFINLIVYIGMKIIILVLKYQTNKFFNWIYWRSKYYLDVLANMQLIIELVIYLSISGIILLVALISKEMLQNVIKLVSFKLSIFFISISYIIAVKIMINFIYKITIYVRVKNRIQEKPTMSFSEYKNMKLGIHQPIKEKDI